MVTPASLKRVSPSPTTASAVARSPVLSTSTTLAPRSCPASRAASSAAASARKHRSSSARSGSNVTMLTVSVTAMDTQLTRGKESRILAGGIPSARPGSPLTLMRNDKTVRYPVEAMLAFARELLERAGVRNDIARDTADVLLEGDLLEH